MQVAFQIKNDRCSDDGLHAPINELETLAAVSKPRCFKTAKCMSAVRLDADKQDSNLRSEGQAVIQGILQPCIQSLEFMGGAADMGVAFVPNTCYAC